MDLRCKRSIVTRIRRERFLDAGIALIIRVGLRLPYGRIGSTHSVKRVHERIGSSGNYMGLLKSVLRLLRQNPSSADRFYFRLKLLLDFALRVAQ
jgi:hypothetical protein